MIDVLLAVVIFGAIVSAFSSGILEGRAGTSRSGSRIRAAYLAEEGLEVVRTIRDATDGYSDVIDDFLTDGTDYKTELSGSDWAISIHDSSLIDGIFTRIINFAEGASSNQRIITSAVTWNDERGNNMSVIARAYLTQWREDPPPPPPDWSKPEVVGSVLASANWDTEIATPEKIAVKDNYAYVVASYQDDSNALLVYNVSDLAAPILSFVRVFVNSYDIAISGDYAYIATADSSNELKIVDVSNPPTSVTCCAGEVDLPGSAIARGIHISGNDLFITREQSANDELFLYDIGANATNPPLLRSWDSFADGTRNMYGVSSIDDAGTTYAYAGSSYTTDELTVVDMTAATPARTGGGDAGTNNLKSKAVDIHKNGAYVGIDATGLTCEVYSFELTSVSSPSAGTACGGAQSYDAGADEGTSEKVHDMLSVESLDLLFVAADTKRASTNHYLHILDVSDVTDINNKDIYDGDSPAPTNITVGYGCTGGDPECPQGMFYRESDNTLFMVMGMQSTPGADFLVIQAAPGEY